MGILNSRAEALRLLAAKLEQMGADLPRKAKEVLRLIVPANTRLSFQQRIMLHFANDPEFIQHTIRDAGVRMGVEISKKLKTTFTGLRFPNYSDPFCPLGRDGVAEYEARVYVLAPQELENVVERALEIGRTLAADEDKPITATEIKNAFMAQAPLDYGQVLYWHGNVKEPRFIVRSKDVNQPVRLLDREGAQANAYRSFSELARAVGDGLQYQRTAT